MLPPSSSLKFHATGPCVFSCFFKNPAPPRVKKIRWEEGWKNVNPPSQKNIHSKKVGPWIFGPLLPSCPRWNPIHGQGGSRLWWFLAACLGGGHYVVIMSVARIWHPVAIGIIQVFWKVFSIRVTIEIILLTMNIPIYSVLFSSFTPYHPHENKELNFSITFPVLVPPPFMDGWVIITVTKENDPVAIGISQMLDVSYFPRNSHTASHPHVTHHPPCCYQATGWEFLPRHGSSLRKGATHTQPGTSWSARCGTWQSRSNGQEEWEDREYIMIYLMYWNIYIYILCFYIIYIYIE